jgi:P27 family predicted phage terminase small subunit
MRQIPPPKDFDADARAVWSAAQRQLRLQGTWNKTDAPLLEMYVRTVRLAQRARTAAEEWPFMRDANGAVMIGHVEMKVAENAEAAALKYATSLLLTPESRKRHGVTIPSGATSELEKLVG